MNFKQTALATTLISSFLLAGCASSGSNSNNPEIQNPIEVDGDFAVGKDRPILDKPQDDPGFTNPGVDVSQPIEKERPDLDKPVYTPPLGDFQSRVSIIGEAGEWQGVVVDGEVVKYIIINEDGSIEVKTSNTPDDGQHTLENISIDEHNGELRVVITHPKTGDLIASWTPNGGLERPAFNHPDKDRPIVDKPAANHPPVNGINNIELIGEVGQWQTLVINGQEISHVIVNPDGSIEVKRIGTPNDGQRTLDNIRIENINGEAQLVIRNPETGEIAATWTPNEGLKRVEGATLSATQKAELKKQVSKLSQEQKNRIKSSLKKSRG